ncbi:hypothetical protein [Rufibacter aurantiacus]|uniref:hypothetical protein n=1 Tax=Rufibacter aurantiacus TaxID=2817374 RepID=UPI001B30EF2B|nr:hypothetical protein [Rufibacter aurantiacus]
MVQYDPDNFYSQLGISPLMPTDEIKAFITSKQMEARKNRRGQTNKKLNSADDIFIRLQKILDAIGSSKKREKYDYENPQNQVLTVQPSPYDNWLDRKNQIELVTALLVEVLGNNCWLPHPDSLSLWMPTGIDSDLETYLTHYFDNNPEF